jgi:hypothetical protein
MSSPKWSILPCRQTPSATNHTRRQTSQTEQGAGESGRGGARQVGRRTPLLRFPDTGSHGRLLSSPASETPMIASPCGGTGQSQTAPSARATRTTRRNAIAATNASSAQSRHHRAPPTTCAPKPPRPPAPERREEDASAGTADDTLSGRLLNGGLVARTGAADTFRSARSDRCQVLVTWALSAVHARLDQWPCPCYAKHDGRDAFQIRRHRFSSIGEEYSARARCHG